MHTGLKNRLNTYGFLDSKKSVTHPATSGAVSTDVRKTFLIVSIGSTERHLLNRLIHDQTLQLQDEE